RERETHAFVVGGCREPRRSVPITDGGNTPRHGRGLVAGDEILDVVDDRRRRGRDRGLTAPDTPARERSPVTPGRVQTGLTCHDASTVLRPRRGEWFKC